MERENRCGGILKVRGRLGVKGNGWGEREK